jgi:tetratricopeptide (TPR) repeat protein
VDCRRSGRDPPRRGEAERSALGFLFLQPICLSQRNAPLVRPGNKLVVRGPATAFGIKVETISLPERAAAPPPQTLPPAPAPVPPAVSDSGLPVGELVDRGRKALVDKNYSEGMHWYRMAADQGDAAAQLQVGGLYANGWGVRQNYPEAMQWFRKAAAQDNPAAQNNIGELYANGWGVPQNYPEAMQWFRKAAEQGHPAAQNNIGGFYANGRGVPRDYAEAMRWFRTSAAPKDMPRLRLISAPCTRTARECRWTTPRRCAGFGWRRPRDMRRRRAMWAG